MAIYKGSREVEPRVSRKDLNRKTLFKASSLTTQQRRSLALTKFRKRTEEEPSSEINGPLRKLFAFIGLINDPRYNFIPDITINMLCPGNSCSKMYRTPIQRSSI